MRARGARNFKKMRDLAGSHLRYDMLPGQELPHLYADAHTPHMTTLTNLLVVCWVPPLQQRRKQTPFRRVWSVLFTLPGRGSGSLGVVRVEVT